MYLSYDARYATSFANNTVRGYLYSTNSSNVPLSVVATSSTIYNPSDITPGSFVKFESISLLSFEKLMKP